jgi:hypothetical protein
VRHEIREISVKVIIISYSAGYGFHSSKRFYYYYDTLYHNTDVFFLFVISYFTSICKALDL